MYESPEGGKIELAKYTFSKNYYNDTANLIIEALPKAYEARVFIHVDKIQQHPENNVGVDFPNIIHFIKTGQHYDLLKLIMDVDGVPHNAEEKKVMVIARKGRYFFYVQIRMHSKPKIQQDDKKFGNSDW